MCVIGAGRHERSGERATWRNGYRDRSLDTRVGTLNLKMGGPSVHPPFEQKIVGNSARNDWKQSDPEEAARRSVYVFAKRAIPYPDLAILGLPESSTSASRRAVATTSVQALLLLNGRFVSGQAAAMAERLREARAQRGRSCSAPRRASAASASTSGTS